MEAAEFFLRAIRETALDELSWFFNRHSIPNRKQNMHMVRHNDIGVKVESALRRIVEEYANEE